MSDKKAYPVGGQPPTGYVPAPPPGAYGVPSAAPYGVFPSQAQLYAAAAAAQGPPPTYDQSLAHPAAVNQQMYAQSAAAAQMYAAQGYPGYLGYPAYSPMQAYYPSLAAYSAYPTMQQAAQLRPTIMVPMGLISALREGCQGNCSMCYAGEVGLDLDRSVSQNGFDAGARFDGIAQPVLPPAPPGVPANAAQLAAMAGHNVALSQKKGSFLAGGSEGGYTFW